MQSLLKNLKKLIGEIQIKMDCTEPSHQGLYRTPYLLFKGFVFKTAVVY